MSNSHPFAEYIDYDFNEEESGFGEPYIVPESQRTHSADSATSGDPDAIAPRGPSMLLKVCSALGMAGIVFLLLSIASGIGGGLVEPGGTPPVQSLLGDWIATWTGTLTLLLLPFLAGAIYFWEAYRHQTPGIKNDGVFFKSATSRGMLGWLAGVAMTAFYVALYWYPDMIIQSGLVELVDPIAMAMTGRAADHWFAYTVLYTLAVLTFGVRMMMRYRHNPYHLIRTASVMFFQTGLAFILPQLLKAFNQPEFYPTYFWPLKRDVLMPGDLGMNWTATDAAGSVGVAMLIFAGAMTVLATPVLTYLYGKRWYCSWVCGCGGLAETLGDPYRHLSDKSDRAWRIERIVIYSVLIWIVGLTAVLWLNHVQGGELLGNNGSSIERFYGFWIGSMFAGVAGVGFYPILGSRVWCRFGCPQAAILGILQRFFSRFRITTNGAQCISCGNCSTYCEMGIDVRAYAQKGENIVRASCVGCGVCAAVCPRGVLKLENGSSVLEEERFNS